jgi:hypothetical protein
MLGIQSKLVRYGAIAVVALGGVAGGISFVVLGSDDLRTIAAERAVNTGSDRIAIKGYDAVAYFTEGRAVKGQPEYTHRWHDAVWQFASAAHRDAFALEPDRYAPQYGGFCALGIKVGKAWDIDPQAWSIVDGKLYFGYDQQGIEDFERHKVANIEAADEVWRSVVGEN